MARQEDRMKLLSKMLKDRGQVAIDWLTEVICTAGMADMCACVRACVCAYLHVLVC